MGGGGQSKHDVSNVSVEWRPCNVAAHVTRGGGGAYVSKLFIL
jgi:hypothetical protein